MVKHQGHQNNHNTLYIPKLRSSLYHRLLLILSVVPIKKPAAYKTKTFHVRAFSRGVSGAAWGGLMRSGAGFLSKTDVTFPRWLQGERSKPSPETTKGDAWLHSRLPHFTLYCKPLSDYRKNSPSWFSNLKNKSERVCKPSENPYLGFSIQKSSVRNDGFSEGFWTLWEISVEIVFSFGGVRKYLVCKLSENGVPRQTAYL